MDAIKIILGTMTFGPQVDAKRSQAMVTQFLKAGYSELDTAYVYNQGVTERILGNILPQLETKTIRIATKVHPRITGKLDGDAVTMQFEESLHRLNRKSVDILYFHFPDQVTPIDDALITCTRLYEQGKFKELGLSNYPAWMVVDICHMCNERGWLAPTVYQGMYNGLSRKIEAELFPALRKMKLKFYAFNPLAGGLLTGKYASFKEVPSPGRFASLASYRERYWKESYFEAVNHLTECCREAKIKPVEAAFRWLMHHSLLDASAGDGIIVGASSMVQFEQNLDAIKQGMLPEQLLAAFDAAWQVAKPDSPEYFKFF